MINSRLDDFIGQVSGTQAITAEDVRELENIVLADGITSREEAETLLALDGVVNAHASFLDALSRLMVDYVVWGARPTGYVRGEDARWLTSALDVVCHSETSLRIAHAIVEEAQQVDEVLLSFILRGRRQGRQPLAA